MCGCAMHRLSILTLPPGAPVSDPAGAEILTEHAGSEMDKNDMRQ